MAPIKYHLMKTFCTLVSLLFTLYSGIAQQVTTVTAGNFHDGLEIDSAGRVYCSDYRGTKVYRFNPLNNQVIEFAGGLVTPNGIGLSPDNKLYVCEATANRITVFDTAGNQVDQITGLNNPTGIKYSRQTNQFLLVSYNGSSLLSLDPMTNTTTVITSGPPLSGPSGIAFINNDVYISNYNNRKIFKLSATNQLNEIAQLPSGASQYNHCGFLTAKGNYLYATQIGENRIYQIDPDSGSVSLFAGSTKGNADGALNDATFNGPNGIVADPTTDRIYISDATTRNLRIISNLSIGLNENFTDRFQLFPLPVKDQLQIAFKHPESVQSIEIIDMNGKVIFSYSRQALPETIDISTMENGNYVLKVKEGDTVFSKKFIKQ